MHTLRPAFDPLLVQIADYAASTSPCASPATREIAALCLTDALACAAGALDAPDCMRIVGPIVPGASLTEGARVPFTRFALDPVRAAFSTSTLIRWLDFSDTTFDGGHPSDNLGGILAVADYIDRRRLRPIRMAEALDAVVIAYEIQSRIAAACKLDAPEIGLDAVFAVKVASSAAVTRLLGGTRDQLLNAISSAFVDGASLNAYRQPPNSGTRKGWAGPRACADGVEIALMACGGEMGCPTALTAQPWGFETVLLKGRPLRLSSALDGASVHNVIFKLLPSQRNASTAAEAAIALHSVVAGRLDEVREIVVHTHAEAMERIDNADHLHNAAARDHSLQFVVASALLHGTLTAAHYHEPLASDARLLGLVAKVRLIEAPGYTAGYVAPDQRSTGNAVEVRFTDGTRAGPIEKLFPGGHPARRADLPPLLAAKFERLVGPRLSRRRQQQLRRLLFDHTRLGNRRVGDFMAMLTEPDID